MFGRVDAGLWASAEVRCRWGVGRSRRMYSVRSREMLRSLVIVGTLVEKHPFCDTWNNVRYCFYKQGGM